MCAPHYQLDETDLHPTALLVEQAHWSRVEPLVDEYVKSGSEGPYSFIYNPPNPMFPHLAGQSFEIQRDQMVAFLVGLQTVIDY